MIENQERRRHQRIPARILVDWRVPGTNTTIFSASEDIGLGGVRIRTLTPPKAGTEVSMTLRREFDEKTLRLLGRVAWVRLDDDFCGMGLAFPHSEQDGQEGQAGQAELVELEELVKSLSASLSG